MADLVSILGGGVMGETLISGLLRAGWSADEVVVSERRPERAAELAERFGIKTLSNREAAASADTVVLVVKPQDMDGLLTEVREAIRPDALVVSIAAGITTGFVEQRLPPGIAVVRVMPN